ncbi:hypothetical protein D9758_000604 [Tetrapyrgos nigripes]|uniref:Transmembrane protein n=1 Tax=Tetrapyrgos nigripes TaxID=182062 RepID=A0A8H5GZ45_9AGAR|nr:hypothetical protein D9758_000604 [Tetrapyrgos nigripes]
MSNSDSFEMYNLSKKSVPQQEDGDHSTTYEDHSIPLWALTSSCCFALLSVVLVFFPRLLLFISETPTTESRPTLTPLETFLATHFGIWLTALAISLLLTVPSSSPLHTPDTSTHPLLITTTMTSLLAAFVSYNTSSVGALASLYCIVSGIIGLWGLWAIVFEGSSHVSKKTGADKHTSSFIFGNKASASKRKKQWKKENSSQ